MNYYCNLHFLTLTVLRIRHGKEFWHRSNFGWRTNWRYCCQHSNALRHFGQTQPKICFGFKFHDHQIQVGWSGRKRRVPRIMENRITRLLRRLLCNPITSNHRISQLSSWSLSWWLGMFAYHQCIKRKNYHFGNWWSWHGTRKRFCPRSVSQFSNQIIHCWSL